MRILATILLAASLAAGAAPVDTGSAPFQRQDVFEFAAPPTFQKAGKDRYEIAFAAKGACDVAVAILDGKGTIVRHLAAGVLGPNAPEPLHRDTLAQKLVWDGKNDLGRYVEDPGSHRLRVSLGLKPVFDKVLFWHPNRVGWAVYGLTCDADGVYVHSTEGNPSMTNAHGPADETLIAQYDHDGNYRKTLWPPAADKVTAAAYAPSPMAGQGPPAPGRAPQGKFGPPYGLVLPTGQAVVSPTVEGGYLRPLEANAFIARQGMLLGVLCTVQGAKLDELRFFRLKTDGAMPPGGLYSESLGKRVGPPQSMTGSCGPCWLAASPDGKSVYVSGLAQRGRAIVGYSYEKDNWVFGVKNRKDVGEHAVWRLPAEAAAGAAAAGEAFGDPFLGVRGESGNDEQHFNLPEGVGCDKDGRVYTCDRGNDRIQVFAPDGKFIKSIPVPEPYQVGFDPRTGAIYVLSLQTRAILASQPAKNAGLWLPGKPLKLTKYAGLDNLKVQAELALPVPAYGWLKLLPTFCVDTWAANPAGAGPTIWLVASDLPVQLFVDKGDRFEFKRSLADDLKKEWKGTLPDGLVFGNLAADPRRPYLYLGDSRGGGPMYRDDKAPRIQTHTGQVELVRGATTFGYDGLAYLRDGNVVSRFNPDTGQAVAFDYGEGESGSLRYRFASGDGLGLGVSPDGQIIFQDRWPPVPGFSNSLSNVGANPMRLPNYMRPKLWQLGGDTAGNLDGYQMRNFYPGRVYAAAGAVLVFDAAGQLRNNDAVEAIPRPASGVHMDLQGNVYVGVCYPKVVDGKEIMGNSLAKFSPKGARLIVNGPGVKYPLKDAPNRPPDFKPFLETNAHGAPDDKGPNGESGYGDQAWAEGMCWSFGGYFPFHHGHCICVNARFDLDYFARSFVPESHRQAISVVDSNGNFILRLGEYGNCDDTPNGRNTELGTRNPEDTATAPSGIRDTGSGIRPSVPIRFGHCRYVAVTDDRLYLNDITNRRILSIDLKYEQEATADLHRQEPASRP